MSEPTDLELRSLWDIREPSHQGIWCSEPEHPGFLGPILGCEHPECVARAILED